MTNNLMYLQARIKITELQEQERNMTEVLISYDSAISSGDASSLSEASLREVTPTFSDPTYLHIGPSPTTSPKVTTHFFDYFWHYIMYVFHECCILYDNIPGLH